MPQIYIEEPRKLIQNKKEIEKILNIKFSIKNNIISIEAKAEDEFIATKVIEAINLGFKVPDALLLKDEEYTFQRINIKDLTKRKDLKRVRGRVIGTKGKALDTIEALTDCILSIHDNSIGIIGRTEDIKKAADALKRIIQGSEHSSVYSSLERQRATEKQSL